MSDETSVQGPAGATPKRRGKVKKKHTIGTVLLASLVVLALVTGLGVAFLYRHLNGNLTESDALDEVDNRPDVVAEGALNVLILGSDTRDCEGCDIDDEAGGGGSDTTILLHLSANREHAYGISIPRDSIVTRPECGPDDEFAAREEVKWNEAFALGGEACTIEQFEQETGVRVDDFVVIDFNGFKDMVDAVDGVPVCVPAEIDDPRYDIYIPAGDPVVLRGDQALDYVRARASVGDKSDLGRIKRQQTFLAAMINKVVSAGTLSRPDHVVGFLGAVTKSLRVSPGLNNLARLGKLGLAVQDVGLDNIQFLTVPWEYKRPEYDVLWTKDADRMWRKIRLDKPLTKGLSEGSINAAKPPGAPATTSPSPSPGESPTESPSESTSESPSESPSDEPSPSVSATPSQEEVEAAENSGLCV